MAQEVDESSGARDAVLRDDNAGKGVIGVVMLVAITVALWASERGAPPRGPIAGARASSSGIRA